MDFVFKLPPTVQRYDDIWVVVDQLTKSVHFLPIREKFSPQKLAELFMNHIVSLQGIQEVFCVECVVCVTLIRDVKC